MALYHCLSQYPAQISHDHENTDQSANDELLEKRAPLHHEDSPPHIYAVLNTQIPRQQRDSVKSSEPAP